MEEPKKLAIACQGGGSHTAFTAGVLRELLARGIPSRYQLVALSGTSGGAICATAVWYGLLKQAAGATESPSKWLVDFWDANSAREPWERWLNACSIQVLRLQEQGMLPSLAASPYQWEWLLNAGIAFAPRREYFDFKLLLEQFLVEDVTQRPDEIWIVRINPQNRQHEPKTVQDISDRRNELSGNLSLLQEVRTIELVNQWLTDGFFSPEKQGQLKHIVIRWLEMSPPVAETLDSSSTLERDPTFINQLIEEGVQQAAQFCQNLP